MHYSLSEAYDYKYLCHLNKNNMCNDVSKVQIRGQSQKRHKTDGTWRRRIVTREMPVVRPIAM